MHDLQIRRTNFVIRQFARENPFYPAAKIHSFRTAQNFRIVKLKMNRPVRIGINKIFIQFAGDYFQAEFLAKRALRNTPKTPTLRACRREIPKVPHSCRLPCADKLKFCPENPAKSPLQPRSFSSRPFFRFRLTAVFRICLSRVIASVCDVL